MAFPGHGGGFEASSVVLDDETDLFGGSDEEDVNVSGRGVPGDVGEGFLADAVQGHLDAWREWAGAVHRRVVSVDARLRLPSLDENLECLGEQTSFERCSPEIEDGTPGLFEVGLGEGEGAAQWLPGAF